MFEDRTYKRTFYNAPQSVTSLVAAFLEPSITVLVFLCATLYSDELIDRPALTLCLLVFALTFPGRDRFRAKLIHAAVRSRVAACTRPLGTKRRWWAAPAPWG